MEAGAARATGGASRLPAWLVGVVPLLVLGAGIALFVALGAPGLQRAGVPIEDLAVDRTALHPGEIVLHVRNDGPDPVAVRQVIVNDGYVDFTQTDPEIGRLGTARITARYPWIEGEAYEVLLLTATGATIDHSIDAAAETPDSGLGFLGLMALIGAYVGVIPVAIGMLWLPWVRRIDARWVRFLLAVTIGLLLFLGIEAILEGVEFAGEGAQGLGGPALVYLGAVVAYLVLAAVDSRLGGRTAGPPGGSVARGGLRLAFVVALGIGLHNLGEGLAIGSAYAIGSLALGVALIVGFAVHNTTEGLAIVAPVAGERAQEGNRGGPTAGIGRLALLGLLAGAPVIVGAWIGASAFDASLAAFMFGLGAGAIAQVIVQIAPSVRDSSGRLLHPLAAAGLVAGLAVMYATGLLITV